MKKIIALLLALVMVLALAACGGQAAPADQPAAESSTSTPGTRSSRASSRSTTPFPKA